MASISPRSLPVWVVLFFLSLGLLVCMPGIEDTDFRFLWLTFLFTALAGMCLRSSKTWDDHERDGPIDAWHLWGAFFIAAAVACYAGGVFLYAARPERPPARQWLHE